MAGGADLAQKVRDGRVAAGVAALLQLAEQAAAGQAGKALTRSRK